MSFPRVHNFRSAEFRSAEFFLTTSNDRQQEYHNDNESSHIQDRSPFSPLKARPIRITAIPHPPGDTAPTLPADLVSTGLLSD